MNTMRNLFCAAALLGSAIVFGQTPAETATASVKARTAQLTAELELNAKQSAALERALMNAEQEVTEDRRECARIEEKIDAVFKKNYASLKNVLSADKQKKLLEKTANVCAVHPGCSHDTKTSAACCAGGRGATPATGATPPAKTMEPLKTTIR
ncbi:MAG: hypothetical protein ABI599_08145 [Flavobacteriales bacterium]